MARRPRRSTVQHSAEDTNTLQEAYTTLQQAYLMSRDKKVNLLLERVDALIKSLLQANPE